MKKYLFSDDKQDFVNTLKQYRTVDCLKQINRESVDFIVNSENYELRVAKPVSVIFGVEGSQIPIVEQDMYISPWDLIDLAFHLIVNADDNCGTGFESDADFAATYFLVYNYLHKKESSLMRSENTDSPSRILLLLLGTVGEQIKFQRTHWIFDNMFRDVHILLELTDSKEIDVEGILESETGLKSWKTIVANLVRAYEAFKSVDSLDYVLKSISWNTDDDKRLFKRLIEKYTVDYDEVRASSLGRQILYQKPFVKTRSGEVVSINAYLNLFLCEHAIYWITRDYYNKLNKQDFTNYYGELFEKYFEELLSSCLLPSEYIRIDETKEKRADWKLCIDDFKFLIEQKSTLMRLSAKQQITDATAIMNFVKRAVIPALSQLECTERAIEEGKHIKIVLLYEDYLKSEWLNFIMDLPECEISNDQYYWLVTIREMEMLLYVAKNDRILFEEIITEKINRELHQNGEARGIIDILGDKGIYENKYIREMKTVKELMNSHL